MRGCDARSHDFRRGFDAGRWRASAGACQLGIRAMQVNVRLTAEKKTLLEPATHNRGFNGLSDFIRSVAIEAIKS